MRREMEMSASASQTVLYCSMRRVHVVRYPIQLIWAGLTGVLREAESRVTRTSRCPPLPPRR